MRSAVPRSAVPPPGPLSGTTLHFALLSPFLVLVILIFGISPVYQMRRVPVRLPFAPHASELLYYYPELCITLTLDGSVFIDTQLLSSHRLPTRFREIGARTPQTQVLLRADGRLPFSAVRPMIKQLREAGFRRVSLVTFEGLPIELRRRNAA